MDAMVARKGVALAMERGFHYLIIECDSIKIVKALHDNSPNMSAVGHIVEDSKALLLRITRALVAHTRRQAKGTVHHLARHGIHMDTTSCSWFEEPPDFISNLLVSICN